MVVADAKIIILGTTGASTVIVIKFELAKPGDAQENPEVIIHRTISPFAKAALVYVELFVPTFVPFSFH